MKITIVACLLYVIPFIAKAQDVFDPVRPQKKITPSRINTMLNIDGRLNEPAWDSAASANDFFEVEPAQGTTPSQQTIVKVLYNETYLYIAGICFDQNGKKGIRAPDFKRDFDANSHDLLAIMIDGFKDERNAMAFLVNPYGVQRDVLCFDDRYFDVEWDGLWKTRTQRTDSGWIAEIAIPWKTLRYPETTGQLQTWGINFTRQRRSTNEYYSWSPFPRAYSLTRMSYEALLDSIQVPKAGSNIRIQPYTLMSASKEHRQSDWTGKIKAGGEIKWALTSNKVLDLTVNTDFAQADVDQQVNNLERFSVFFPERRQFFLESGSLFRSGLNANPDGNKGTAMTIQPFFSRRIGLGDNGSPINIQAGARYIQRNEKENFGLMAIRQSSSDILSSADFFVGRYTHRIGKRNQLGALVTSRVQESAPDKLVQGYTNWSGTIDGFFRLSQKLEWNGMISGTTNAGKMEDGIAAYSQLFYRDNYFNIWWNESLVTRNYNPEIGFVNRANVLCTSPGFYLSERGKWLPSFFRTFAPGVKTNFLYTLSTGKPEEINIDIFPVWFGFQDGGSIGFSWTYYYQRLDIDFQPLNAKLIPGRYNYNRLNFQFDTDPSKRWSVHAGYSLGGYYDGRMQHINLSARYSPIPQLAFNTTFAEYRLHDVGIEKLSAKYYLYILQARLALNPRIQLSAFYQRNTTNTREGLNLKFAWEYQPLSYIYLVVNNNGWQENSIKDNSITGIIKLNYLKQF